MRLRLALGSSLSLLIVSAQACGGDDAQPVDVNVTDAGDATATEAGAGDASDATTDAAPPGIRGTITVHTQIGTAGHVLLGDGLRFNQAVGQSGVVTFTDPAIVGPQNVTFVMEPRATSMIVFTLAKIDVPEVWVSTGSSSSSEPFVYRATLKGNTSYPTDPAITRIDLLAMGDDGAFGLGQLLGPDPYSVSVQGRKTTTSCDLFGIGYTNSDPNRLLRAGAVKNIALPAFVPDASTPEVASADLVLDHPFDQPVTITTPNAATYGPDVYGTISYFRKNAQAMQTSDRFTGTTGQVKSIAMTSPFDTLTRVVHARVDGALGYAAVATPLAANETAVTATFPMPASVTSPATTLESDGGAETAFPPGSSVVLGNVDPAAQVTELSLATSRPPADGGAEFLLFWYVDLPRGENSFTFFQLPPDTPERFFSSHSARLEVTTRAYKQATVAEVHGADLDKVDAIGRTRGLSQATMARYFKVK